MKAEIIVTPETEKDLKYAFEWYEDKLLGLGHDFMLQIDAGLKFIQRNPEAVPIEYHRVRKHLIKRFPYKIIYLVENFIIVVLAVIHGRRNPGLVKKIIQ